MNPNSFKSSEEFNVDDEIAKLWASLGEEMKKMNSTTPSNQNAPQLVTRKSPEASRFNPITIDQNAPRAIRRNGPEIPNFSAVSPKKAENTSRENSHGMKLPPTVGTPMQNTSSAKSPEIPNFSHRNNSASEPAKPSYEIPQILNKQNTGPSVPKMPRKQPNITNQENQFLSRERVAPRAETIGKTESRQITKKTIETLQATQALRKKLTKIVGKDIDRVKSSSAARFENARNNLDEKYKIFEQNIRDNKDNLLDVGKKSVAILLSALTIGSTAAALAHQKRSEHATSVMTTAGGEYEKTQDREAEEMFGGKAEIREYTDEDTGKKQIEVLLKNPTLVEQSESQNDESAISADYSTESPEIDTNTNEETTAYYEKKTAAETSTEPSLNVIDESTGLTTAVNHEIENDSKIKDDMGLNINLTGNMQDELEFVRKIFEGNKALYQKIADKIEEDTGISLPKEAICAIHYRESRCDFDAYLQNGEKLGKVTKHVPKGIYFDNFFESAVSAIEDQLKAYQDYNKIDLHSMSGLCKFTNRYNGTGSQKYYGLPSSYVYTGTSKYQGGMYVADGSFDRNKNDTRMGTYPIIAKLANLA